MAQAEHHPLVQLARQAIEAYVRTGERLAVPNPLPRDMQQRAGAFVSLHAHARLRGCIGTIEATHPNLAAEVINNAIMAATEDPRFAPVQPNELADLEVKVDVLTSPEPISSPAELDPKVYGVIVQSGFRRGLLLPDLDGVDTVECQIDIARQKAGIRPGERYQLYRFRVNRYH